MQARAGDRSRRRRSIVGPCRRARRRERPSVGAKRHAQHAGDVAVQGRPQLLPVSDVPQADRVVVAGRSERLAVRTERHRVDGAGRPLEHRDLSGAEDAPQPDHVVGATRGEGSPARAERHTEYLATAAPQRLAERAVALYIPQPNRPVVAARGDGLPVGAEGHAQHAAAMTFEWPAQLAAAGDVPQPHRLVDAAGGQHPPIPTEGHAVDDSRVTLQRSEPLTAHRHPTARWCRQHWPWRASVHPG